MLRARIKGVQEVGSLKWVGWVIIFENLEDQSYGVGRWLFHSWDNAVAAIESFKQREQQREKI